MTALIFYTGATLAALTGAAALASILDLFIW